MYLVSVWSNVPNFQFEREKLECGLDTTRRYPGRSGFCRKKYEREKGERERNLHRPKHFLTADMHAREPRQLYLHPKFLLCQFTSKMVFGICHLIASEF